ncbi:MAG: energy-coupling factor ABC transporter permease [Bacillota bacterium]|jgi:cobalt/nickel transport system permease protein
MHIPDGLLPVTLTGTGYVLLAGTVLGILRGTSLKGLLRTMTRISLVSSVVFVSSMVHIPMGYTSVHFTFAPLAGILLGPVSFVAVGLAIALQWLLLGHGGLSTLGVNTFSMGSAALLAWLIMRRAKSAPTGGHPPVALLAGIAGSFCKVLLGSTLLVVGGFPPVTFWLVLGAHVPVILGEGAITALAARYLLHHIEEKGLNHGDSFQKVHGKG